MKRNPVKTIAVAFAAVVLASAAFEARAQTRVRGTINNVSGDSMSVKTGDGRNVDFLVTDKTNIVFAQPIAISDIKVGDFLAVTSLKRRDGTLAAYDVRRFVKPVNPGHRPFDGLDDQTMTNATVSATVDATKGHELVLTYEGGSQKVTVADGAAITTLMPGQRSQLIAGSYVSVLLDGSGEGKPAARSIEVRKSAPRPPTN